MSLILEALKRSEAERRGARPTASETPAPGRRRAAGWAVGIAIVAVLGAALGWWGSRLWQPAASPAPVTAAEHAEPRTAGTRAGAVAEPERPAALVTSGPTSGAEPTAAQPATPGATGGGDEVGPTPAPTLASSPPPPPRTVTLDDVPVPPSRPPPAAAPSEPAEASPPSAAADLPRFDQLPAVRAEVGALALNMLVYSTDVEARFALINLKRFQEGDEVQPGLRVSEIRRDGVVLSHRGRALLLPSTH